jgi:PAS domain S-box-containing protein
VGQILVIEDDAACRDIVRRILAVKRHSVVEAATAEDGLRLAKENRPDLILTDINLGDADGFSILAAVRANPSLATIPVIMMTGRQEATDMRRGMDSGADDYLQKPFDTLSLIAAVEARLQKQETLRREAVETQARLLAMLEATPDLVGLARPDGQLAYLNRAGRALLGLNEDEPVARFSLADLVSPSSRDEFLEEALPQSRIRGVWSGEGFLRRLSGVEMPVSQVLVTRYTEDGRVDSLATIMRDLTDQKQAESAMSLLAGALMRSQDDERRRIGRELHDSTAQAMAALEIELSRLQRQLGANEAAPPNNLTQCVRLAKQCSQEIRTMSYLLHPPLLDEMGLVSAVRWFLDGFAQRSGIEVKFEASGGFDRLPEQIELTLFRVVQECLSNIHRSSGSKTASVKLVREKRSVRLEVSDEGKGIPAEVLSEFQRSGVSTGVGLSGMRERVRQLRGTFQIEPGSPGTRVWVMLPVSPHEL